MLKQGLVMNEYFVLLYYCYASIENPETFREAHHLFCLQNELRGRVIVAREGLNGTVSGTAQACEAYMSHLHADPRFADTEFKIDHIDKHVFRKLHVRVKPEIVNAGLPHLDPKKRAGHYVEPKEFRTILQSEDPDTVILDVRSNYEHQLGRFKNAVTLDMDNFRFFPEKMGELKAFKNKKIITYCTGGIKCEKASAFLLEQGFENVYQLHGGIIKYGLETDGKDFEGSCYVFDERIKTDVNRSNPKVIATCHVSGIPTDRMVNCANPHCNLHMPLSEKGAQIFNGCCSEDCMNHPDVRPYDGTGCYPTNMNGYNPYTGHSWSEKTKEKA